MSCHGSRYKNVSLMLARRCSTFDKEEAIRFPQRVLNQGQVSVCPSLNTRYRYLLCRNESSAHSNYFIDTPRYTSDFSQFLLLYSQEP